MTEANIYVSVLVLLVGGSVALAWIISATRAEAKRTHGTVAQLRQHFVRYNERLQIVEKQSPTSLAAEVAALSEAVGRLKHTQMKFQGRFDQYMGQGPGSERDPNDVDDPKWRALMRAQQQLPPNGSS